MFDRCNRRIRESHVVLIGFYAKSREAFSGSLLFDGRGGRRNVCRRKNIL